MAGLYKPKLLAKRISIIGVACPAFCSDTTLLFCEACPRYRLACPQLLLTCFPIGGVLQNRQRIKKRLKTFPAFSRLLLPYPPLINTSPAAVFLARARYTNWIATPILASLNISLCSTLTTLPPLIRANWPFCFANASVRGKLISTKWPERIGVVIGNLMKTPVLLMFALRPLKNLFASGSQTLTGQDSVVRLSLRCSIKVSIT